MLSIIINLPYLKFHYKWQSICSTHCLQSLVCAVGSLQVFKFNLYSRLKIALVVYLYIKIANDLKMYLFIYNNIYTSYLFIPEFVQLCSHFVNAERERERKKELPQVILCLLFCPVTQKKYKYYVTWRKT